MLGVSTLLDFVVLLPTNDYFLCILVGFSDCLVLLLQVGPPENNPKPSLLLEYLKIYIKVDQTALDEVRYKGVLRGICRSTSILSLLLLYFFEEGRNMQPSWFFMIHKVLRQRHKFTFYRYFGQGVIINSFSFATSRLTLCTKVCSVLSSDLVFLSNLSWSWFIFRICLLLSRPACLLHELFIS